jgi:hypothetical protein
MIVVPQLSPALLKTFESDFGTSIAQVLWRRIVDHQNWINAALPIGSVIFFYGSQQYANGSTIVDPNACWQFCDGGAVVNTNSPLLGQNVPDLRGKFLRGDDVEGLLGGSDTINLSHNHETGALFDGENNYNSGGDNEQGGPSFHNHPIGSDLGVILRLPPYAELQPYMRIV